MTLVKPFNKYVYTLPCSKYGEKWKAHSMLWGEPEWGRPLVSPSLIWGILLKGAVKKLDGRSWIGLIRQMMGIVCRLFWMRQLSLLFRTFEKFWRSWRTVRFSRSNTLLGVTYVLYTWLLLSCSCIFSGHFPSSFYTFLLVYLCLYFFSIFLCLIFISPFTSFSSILLKYSAHILFTVSLHSYPYEIEICRPRNLIHS